ncbi:MAG: alpha/beta hydrolase [Gemmatimonadaceae bacterium]
MPRPIPSPRESGFTTATDAPLYWCTYGPADAPTLIVMHGGPGAHHDYLLPQMLHLADRYNLFFYDQRGGGQSKAEHNRNIIWQTHVADLEAIISEFNITAPSIVGYSFGGILAVLYALTAASDDHLQTPSRLALIDPAPLSREYRRQFEAEFARRQNGPAIAALRDELASSELRDRDRDEYRQRVFELAVAPYFANPANARDLTPFRVIGRVQTSVWDSLGPEYDLLDQLHPMGFPTLFIHGRDDPIPMQSSIQGAKRMDAELVLLDDCGHVPYVEQPGALFAALDKFLAATDSM